MGGINVTLFGYITEVRNFLFAPFGEHVSKPTRSIVRELINHKAANVWNKRHFI